MKKIILLLGIATIGTYLLNARIGDWWRERAEEVVETVREEVIDPAVEAIKEKTEEVVETIRETGEKVVNITKEKLEEVKDLIKTLLERFEPLDPWVLPNPQLRYDQVCYLGAHNAFANIEEGFVYAQQKWSLENQLERGIRCFLLDFHVEDNTVKLCHNECKKFKFLKPTSPYRTVLNALQMVKRWLDAHPQEILTIEIENYATAEQTYSAFKNAGLMNLILTKKDWDPKNHEGKWPQLSWMIQRNRRLVVFDAPSNDTQDYVYNYAFKTDIDMIRSMYGSFDVEPYGVPRHPISDPQPRIFQFNFFGKVTPQDLLRKHNIPDMLKRVFEECKKFLLRRQVPNQIALDYIHLGNPMKWVNELNSNAQPE